VVAFKNIEAVLSGILNMDWDGIVNVIVGALSNIPDAMSNINWFDVGTNIMLGIQNGILAMIQTVIDTAMYAGEAILAALQGFFGINSPSELMKSVIGENLGLGVIAGWEAVIQPTVLQPALAGAAQGIQPQSMGTGAVSGAGAGAGGGDAMLAAEIRQLIRSLPNEIAMAVRTAVSKGNA